MSRRVLIGLAAAAAMALWGAGSLYAAHSDHGCGNCHVPHRAGMDGDAEGNASWGVPLWSTRQTADGLPTFTLYHSPTFDPLGTDIGQPDGPSRLCLGCHDGTYYVFDFLGDAHVFDEGDLERSHPISFTYDTALAGQIPNGELLDPVTAPSGLGGTIDEDILDEMHKMQCSTCHDVHLSGIGEYLLRYDIGEDGHDDHLLCRVCHVK